MSDSRSIDQLIAEIEAGFRPKYVYFWGHTPRKASVVDKSCFSQWFPSPFRVDGVDYSTAEHFMMAGKARLFGDAEMEANILAAEHPNAAKKFGRKVRNFDQAAWAQHRYQIVLQANLAKFQQNPAMRDFLLSTAPRVLVEASPYDRIWGIGMDANHADVADPTKWNGLNLLGFVLMDVRAQLMNGE